MYAAPMRTLMQDFALENMLPDLELHGRRIVRMEVNRPALQLTGFYENFDADRVQIIGRVEHSYLLSLEEEQRKAALEEFFAHRVPCVIFCKGMEIFPEMLELGRKYDVPIFRTKITTSSFMADLINWLRNQLAERVTLHGVLLDIYGEGVLILGDSGIGKSETALELIKRGHRLIADDAVEIKRVPESGNLIGTCPELIRNLIELRGIGIINVKELFGLGAVKDRKNIDLIIRLELWNGVKREYDRLGLSDQYMEILGTKILCNTIPIRPGRNVAVICESAAINNRQKKMGYDAAQELASRIDNNIMKSE